MGQDCVGASSIRPPNNKQGEIKIEQLHYAAVAVAFRSLAARHTGKKKAGKYTVVSLASNRRKEQSFMLHASQPLVSTRCAPCLSARSTSNKLRLRSGARFPLDLVRPLFLWLTTAQFDDAINAHSALLLIKALVYSESSNEQAAR